MNRLDRQAQSLALLLAFVAGSVDAIGFLSIGGFFVSFMSGNSTRLGVALAEGAWVHAMIAGGLILTFVIGVVLGSYIGHMAGYRRPTLLTAMAAFLLCLAALLYQWPATVPGTAMTVLAMGMVNATFERDGQITFGITYMTGALVRVGQAIAAATRGGDRWDWLVHARLWAALASGAVIGGMLHTLLGTSALWAAAVLLACVAVVLTVRPLGKDGALR